MAVRRRHECVIERHPLPPDGVIRALRQELVIRLRQVWVNLFELSEHFVHDGALVARVVGADIQLFGRRIRHGDHRGNHGPRPRVVEVHVVGQHNVADAPRRARIAPYLRHIDFSTPMKNHRNVGQVLCGLLKPVKLGTECGTQIRVLVQYALHLLRRARQNDAGTPEHDGFIIGACSQCNSGHAIGRNNEPVNFRMFRDDHAAFHERVLPNAE